MRVLRFDGSDAAKNAFLHLHIAMLATEVRGIEQIRRVGKIIDKLEGIGVKEHRITKSETGENIAGWHWRLSDTGGELWFDDAEFGEIKTRMNATPWLPQGVRHVVRTFELLDAAPEEDPSKPKLVAPEQETA